MFAPESYEPVKQRLDASRKSLDAESNTLINVSVWKTVADAKQMDTLQAMRDLACEFIAAGVTFERPISNYETCPRCRPGSRPRPRPGGRSCTGP